MTETGFSVHPAGKAPPAAVIRLAEQIRADGGTPLAVYREPVGDPFARDFLESGIASGLGRHGKPP